ncbi:hypothetical protein NBRC111894_2851 [Sporolactobacillus inulinus]|uniref:Uncharacterized protein n=1 Tax=Sporolactobacillus inulinus TaxID=2078 RepID=A0A4Y1ZDV4_9BACL|nr:hypothetical protein [Sporolactobacillus inulinus]GAY77297.1 hypothetical protein NBRC111894_2851 [Sporolactobacillus inulinus]
MVKDLIRNELKGEEEAYRLFALFTQQRIRCTMYCLNLLGVHNRRK